MENNLIKLTSFSYNKQSIPLTKSKINILIKGGYLKTKKIHNEEYFYRDEAMNILKIEQDLTDNYLTTEKFLIRVCRTSSTTFYSKSLIEILSKCNQVCKIKSVKYINSLYFDKNDVNEFFDNVYARDEVLKKLDINIYIYEKLVNLECINLIRISKNTEYISESDLSKLAELSKGFSSLERKAKWVKVTAIIKSKVFSELASKSETLYKICFENSIQHFKNFDNVLYVNYHSLSSFYRKKLNLTNYYYTLTEIRKLFGMNNTSLTLLKPMMLVWFHGHT